MEKKCSYCKQIKDVSFFYKSSNSKCGLQSTCKKCSYEQTKDCNEKRKIIQEDGIKKTKTKSLTLSGVKQSDYCEMYKMVFKMGFDPSNSEKDVHTQFCEKWGLKVSKSPRKGTENHWTYQDCHQ